MKIYLNILKLYDNYNCRQGIERLGAGYHFVADNE